MQNSYLRITLLVNLAGEINTFFTTWVLLLLGIQDVQWVKNRLRGISMRLTENYKFGKTHFSLESVKSLSLLQFSIRKKIQVGTKRIRSRSIGSAEQHFNPYTTCLICSQWLVWFEYMYSNNPNPNPNPNFVYESLICERQFGGWK